MSALGVRGGIWSRGELGGLRGRHALRQRSPAQPSSVHLVGASSPSRAMMDMVMDSCLRGPCPCPREGVQKEGEAVFLAMRPPAGRSKVWGE